MNKYIVDFEVNMKSVFEMEVEAESPQEALELVSDIEFDRHEAEEEFMIDSWDDLTTVRILGERVKDDTGYHTNRYEKPIEFIKALTEELK